MFTVKWIADNGAHHLYTTNGAVSFTPPDEHRKKPMISFVDQEDQRFCTLDNGEIFVMNANGKTVANYVLETKDFPHGIAPRAA